MLKQGKKEIFSENAEYHVAKDAQGMLEYKINELDKKLMNVKLIDASQIDTQSRVFSKVTIKNKITGKEVIYTLVSEGFRSQVR